MSLAHDESGDRDRFLDEVVTAYCKATEAGTCPDRAQWLARYPMLAEELAEFFDGHERVERFTRPLRAVARAALLPLGEGIETPLEAVGAYELLEVIGQGGMGVVYRARQYGLGRLVALKMLRLQPGGSSAEVRRLRNEAEMVAGLDHPHIVPIYEVGEHQGRPYFSMKLVEGGSLVEHLPRFRDDPRAAARLLVTLAQAVHHAHQRGILHRDLKPSNILLDPDGRPYVSDFGLAKRLDVDSSLTHSGAFLGTPSYMSPEQVSPTPDSSSRAAASRRGAGATTATDVYGLGAVLYALLTGRPPFRGGTVLETLEQVKHQEPTPPGTLNPRVDRDLETICLKCLEKEPAKRYGSAEELARDVEHWLAGEPITARPVSRWERAWRWCRRNQTLATACGFALAALVAVAVVSLLWALRESEAATRLFEAAQGLRREQEQTAEALTASEKNRRESERQTASLTLERGLALCEQGEIGRGLLWLARSLTLLPEGSEDLEWVIRANLESWSRHLHPLRAVLVHRGQVLAMAFSPDGSALWTASADGKAQRWETASSRPVGQALPHTFGAYGLALSPDGRTLLTLSGHGEMLSSANADSGFTNPNIRWRLGGAARFWDTTTGSPLGLSLRDSGRILAAAFSPDGRTVLTGHREKSARLWETRTGNPVGGPLPTDGEVWAVAFSRDGSAALTASSAGTTQLWDTATGKPLGSPFRQASWSQWIWSAAFSPDGRTILIGKSDHTAQVWDRAAGKLVRVLPRQRAGIFATAFSPDGRTALTGGGDRTARLWDVATGTQVGPALRHRGIVQAASFSPDSHWIATGSWDQTARLWQRAADGYRVVALPEMGTITAAALSRDGSAVLTASEQKARLWRTATGEAVGQPLEHRDRIIALAVSPDGRTLLTGSRDRTAQLWEAATGKPLGEPLRHAAEVFLVSFSPDGQSFVTLADKGSVRLWETATRRPLGESFTPSGTIQTVRYSPDGKLLLAMDAPGRVYLREVWTGRKVGQAGPYQSRDFQAAFSPDGQSVLIRHEGGVSHWGVGTGREEFHPLRQADESREMLFSPGGRLLLSTYGDSTARFWDALTGWPIGAAHQRYGSLRTTAFSGDGATLWITRLDQQSGVLMKVPSPLEGPTERLVLWSQVITGMEIDRDEVEHVLDAPTWQERSRRLQQLGGPPAT